MLEADVLRGEEGGEAVVGWRAQVEGNIAVEGFDGDCVELFGDEADGLEVAGAIDL